MDDIQRHSLAVALSHIFHSFGKEVSADRLEPLLPPAHDWSAIPGLDDVESGQYGTYPYNSPSIVRFDDGSYHYVDSPHDRTILDSHDGQSKRMEHYGTPNAWATFSLNPDEELPKTVPMPYMYNLVNGIQYNSFGTPKKMYVNKPEGIDLMDFSGPIDNLRDFHGVPGTHLKHGTEVRIMGSAHHPVIPSGYDFLIPQEPINVWGEFTRTGKPAKLHGYKQVDLSDTKPAPIIRTRITTPPPAPVVTVPLADVPADTSVNIAPPLTTVEPKPRVSNNPKFWHFRYLREDQQPVKYMVMRRLVIPDYSNPGSKLEIPAKKTLSVYGTFATPKGTKLYIRPVLNGELTPLFDYWFGVTEVNADGTRNVEELPDYHVPPEELPTPEERAYIKHVQNTRPKRRPVSDHIVNIGTLSEVILVKGVYKIKDSVKGITTWKR